MTNYTLFLIVLSLLAVSPALCGKGCDDEMGGEDASGLVLVSLPRPRQSSPPTGQAWVAKPIQRALADKSFLKRAFTSGGRRPSSVTVASFTLEKLCVPQTKMPVAFRAKVKIIPTDTKSAGPYMIVKMRFDASGNMSTWGRSAS